ncbi:serine/threonine-protein kinase [Micromonospora saelicesensis]|uniref:serine/threonine-protein kinase n=1 Tax=Micromonospora saelicesensis TaxID=285676 RepID=UPI003CF6DA86
MAIEIINGRYEVEERLGSGGMGEVWRAFDPLLGRDVAIKFVGERELRESPGAESMLRDEARAAGKLLGHPQIVAVLDFIETTTALHRGPALVMEYVAGCNLAEWINVHHPHFDEVTRNVLGLYISIEVIQAIQAAHRQEILHRDIKPLNILVSMEGRVKVADFGLARVIEAITRTHTVWGRQTPLYAAPEQWRGERPDMRTDVYQLCATLYHLLSGRPANQGDGLMGLYHWHQVETLTPLAELAPSLAVEVTSVIDRGLHADQDERPDLWEIFDPISKSIMNALHLEIDVGNCTEGQVESIAALTDFGLDQLKADPQFGTILPNPMEAAQEALAVVLLGGKSVLTPAPSVPAPRSAEPKAPPPAKKAAPRRR